MLFWENRVKPSAKESMRSRLMEDRDAQ